MIQTIGMPCLMISISQMEHSLNGKGSIGYSTTLWNGLIMKELKLY
jgi:hypothetical protein